jgi:pyruvate dehydrogenase E2 component (dihydrolipoamide acetyltransferase)
MATLDIKLPEIGEGVTEGELVNWLVKVGDTVKVDQPIVEIMTDKATVEIPSHTAGTVKALKFNPGDMMAVDSVIMTLETSGDAKAAPAKAEHKEAPKAAVPTAAAKAPVSNGSHVGATSGGIQPPVAASHVLATPSTRRLAREVSVDVNTVSGTGLAGRVTRDDVLSAKGGGSGAGMDVVKPATSVQIPRPAFKSNQGAQEERVPLRGIRKKIAENMQMYKHIIPHFSLMDEVDVTSLVKMRDGLKAETEKMGVKVTYLPFVMKAIIAASRNFPMVNASIDDASQEVVYKKYFNIGFAADTPNGLVVPVIKDADQKSILQISQEIIELAKKARDGKLALDEMKGATVTVTNIGSIGGTYATPIINHPEVAIFGMYKIYDKPVLINGKWKARKMMNVSVTADHRLIDGAVAARFMNDVIARLQNPARLMLDLA